MLTHTTEETMPLNSEPQEALLGDPSQWVDRWGDALLRFALSRVGRREVAEDLVQETFLAAWKSRGTFDGRSSFSTWLGGILKRKIADHYRRQGRDRMLQDVEACDVSGPMFGPRGKWLDSIAHWGQPPEQLAENAEFWPVFAHCLADLPAHLAEAFQLREMRSASMEQVAAATGVTPKNLSVRLHRARLLLRRCLDRKWFRGATSRRWKCQ